MEFTGREDVLRRELLKGGEDCRCQDVLGLWRWCSHQVTDYDVLQRSEQEDSIPCKTKSRLC